jgi:hypothetical protein
MAVRPGGRCFKNLSPAKASLAMAAVSAVNPFAGYTRKQNLAPERQPVNRLHAFDGLLPRANLASQGSHPAWRRGPSEAAA